MSADTADIEQSNAANVEVQFKKRRKRQKKVQFVANQVISSENHDHDRKTLQHHDHDKDEMESDSDTDLHATNPATAAAAQLYDEHQDGIDEQFVKQKYSTLSAAQLDSDCTVCCAKCFVFISYNTQKHKQRPNEYRCTTIENCIVDTSKAIKANHYAVFCEHCDTELGTRETVAHNLPSTSTSETETKKNDDNDENPEKEIWTLISSNLSPPMKPQTPVINVSAKDTSDADEHQDDHDNENKETFVYHLSNVLPGVV